MKKEYYNIEITDTYGGEANYCWVRRFRVKAKSIRGAILTLKRLYCAGWKVVYSDSDSARYDLKGAAICCFVTYDENQND